MGFSQADWLELQRLQANLGKIRFGPRQQRPEPLQLSFLPGTDRPKAERRKKSGEPGYERYQLRLW